MPRNCWNYFSHFLAAFSLPTIGSPIIFSTKELILREETVLSMNAATREQYLNFCYPVSMPNRDEEIAVDKQYWNRMSILNVYLDCRIIATVQLIQSETGLDLPVNYAKSDDVDIAVWTKSKRSIELYRFRRSFDCASYQGVLALFMIFKAVWAKVIQTKTYTGLLTFDADQTMLMNLYAKRLCFTTAGSVTYNNSDKKWTVLVKDFHQAEKFFAPINKRAFFLQTWNRSNLKQRVFLPVTEDA